ncbi:MAG: outer membrane protein assembly factor BamD, partial [Planctomycetales bacterium]|nr:outer membrane protein assembly factor BamD [Planctomycetales bacterium]
AQVKTGMAQRDYHMAQYYERKGYYGAARIYHQQVASDYARTPLAEKAHQRLADIRDKPAIPSPRLIWLSSLFPEEKEDPLEFAGSAAMPPPMGDVP